MERKKQKPFLTKREIQILIYLVKGYDAEAIAGILKMKYATVKKHRENIYRKTGCNSIGELIKYAWYYKYITMKELTSPLISIWETMRKKRLEEGGVG